MAAEYTRSTYRCVTSVNAAGERLGSPSHIPSATYTVAPLLHKQPIPQARRSGSDGRSPSGAFLPSHALACHQLRLTERKLGARAIDPEHDSQMSAASRRGWM